MLGDGILDRLQIERRVSVDIGGDRPKALWVTSVPDQILRKLDWYREGGEIPDRQWRDVYGLVRLHRHVIDVDDLRRVGTESGLLDLVDRALAEVEVDGN